MSIVCVGDVHGFTKQYQKWIERNLDPSVRTIQIGDMGIGFAGVGLPAPGMGPLGSNHKWFRGNHDAPEKCRQHPNYLGDYGYLEEDDLFWVAGAWSIDRHMRIEGKTWWADEELSYQELQKAIDLYIEKKPRFVLSHEAPAIAAKNLLYDLQGAYFAAKLACSMSRTSEAMQVMLAAHSPEEWVFGHYHVDKSFKVEGYKTKFTCVGGMMHVNDHPKVYELKTN